jgi:hypothetical protein
VDKHQHKGIPDSFPGDHSTVKEIPLPKRLGMPLQKIIPTIGFAAGREVEPCSFRIRFTVAFEIDRTPSLYSSPRIRSYPPDVLPSQLEDQPADIQRLPLSAPPKGDIPLPVLSEPA